MITLINGNSEIELKNLESNSVDSIICDPPYGINIDNLAWDKDLPSSQIWKECFRVLKPGGFLCAMSGARLYHRLATNIESVGFITHQMMIWAHASGMPKGTCLAKMIENAENKNYPDDNFRNYLRTALKSKKLSASKVEEMLSIRGMFSHYLGKSQPQFPSSQIWEKLKVVLDLDNSFDHHIMSKPNSSSSESSLSGYLKGLKRDYEPFIPKSINAKKWHGYRFGLQTLRPTIEPVYIGQKPIERKMVDNVQKYNTGALNVEGAKKKRYPSNFVTDGSKTIEKTLGIGAKYFDDSSIFYSSKAKKDKTNDHPTIKPIKLMEHLVKLFTPEGGIVLDPFTGSGSTGVASILNGYKFIGIESDPHYFNIAKGRLSLNESA